MKKEAKKFIIGLLITAVTLAAGYGITMLSFSLFGDMSINQMRAVFAADMIAFISVGALSYFLYESKKIKERKRREFEIRHRRRVELAETENAEINKILFQLNKVA